MRIILRPRATGGTLPLVLLGVALAACGEQLRENEAVQTATAEGRLDVANDASAEQRGVSLVRLIHALPRAGDATVTADDALLFSAVAFSRVTPYREVRENITRFRLQASGLDTSVAGNNEVMLDGSHYTVLALPDRGEGARLRVLHDEFARDDSVARLRVVHGLGDAGPIDVALEGRDPLLFAGLDAETEAAYADVPAGTGAVLVSLENGGRQLLRKRMRFEPAHAYTLVLTGATAGHRGRTVPPRIDAILVDDRVLERSATHPARRFPDEHDSTQRGPS